MSVSSPALPGWYKHFTEKYRQARCWQGDYACWLNPGDHDGWWSCQTKNCLCPTILGLSMEKSWKIHVLGFVGICCLVVWNMNFIFPFIGNNDPNWLFSEGLQPPTSLWGTNHVSQIPMIPSVTIPSSNRDPEDHPEIPMNSLWNHHEIPYKLWNSHVFFLHETLQWFLTQVGTLQELKDWDFSNIIAEAKECRRFWSQLAGDIVKHIMKREIEIDRYWYWYWYWYIYIDMIDRLMDGRMDGWIDIHIEFMDISHNII